jgi:hypothetical protein
LYRTVPNTHKASSAQLDEFKASLTCQYLSASARSLNLTQLWIQFKKILLDTAKQILPTKTVSLSKVHVHPEAIANVFAAMKALDYLLIKFSSKPPLLDRFSANWSHTRSRLLHDFERLNDDMLLKDFTSSFPLSIHEFSSASLEFHLLKQSCRRIKRLLNALLALRLRQHQIDSIKFHTEQRDVNFIDNKKQFLSSALNREFRCIVLDRVLTFSNPPSSTPRLLLRPEDIK